MRKLYCGLLVIILVLVMTGCSTNLDKELCKKIDKIEVLNYTDNENYDELRTILQNNYNKYCSKNSKVCIALNDYIKATKTEINTEDCSNKDGSWKDVCESNNKMKVLDKQNSVNYRHEELWAICNEK